jgi:hypothetical protein
LKYGHNNTGIYPCGESFPIDHIGADNYVSKKNRRVEVMFFGSGAMPNLSAPASASSVSKSEAPVFDSSKVVVKPAPPATKPRDKSLFEDIINWAGFEWDSEQGIFYSRIDAWQHNVGYFEIYDIGAPLFLMFIDCEPIRFKYDNRSWNIELWKGQYGICTGAEIGIYVGEFQLNSGNSSIDHTVNRLKFGDDTNCAGGDDMLVMSFVLKKNGRVLFTRDSDDKKTPEVETHWWLTGFKPGEVSSASELQMDLTIAFKDEVMRDAFVNALTGMGYSSSGIKKDGNKVSFTYGQPKSKQPGIFSSLDITEKFEQLSTVIVPAAGNVISKVTAAIPNPISGNTVNEIKKTIPNPVSGTTLNEVKKAIPNPFKF